MRPVEGQRVRRKSEGKPPPGGKLVAERDGWVLWETSKSSAPWLSLKLSAAGVIAERANYWFGWNTEEKRISNGYDHRLLKQRYPAVLEWVVEVVQDYGAPDPEGDK